MNYTQLIYQYTGCSLTHTYFEWEPKSKYLDCLDCGDDCRKDFQLGDKELRKTNYERDKIIFFRITFRYGCNFVDLSWNKDKLIRTPFKPPSDPKCFRSCCCCRRSGGLVLIVDGYIKTKNVFVKNRLKDIHKGIAKLTEGGIHEKFKFVNTNDNPADLIARDVSLKVESQFLFWLHGPPRLVSEAFQWSASELDCLSSDSRMLVLNNAVVIFLLLNWNSSHSWLNC